MGDIFHPTDAPERDARQHGLVELRLCEHGLGQWGFDKCRRDAVHSDPTGRKLDRHGLCEPFNGVFGHAVNRAFGRAHVPHLG